MRFFVLVVFSLLGLTASARAVLAVDCTAVCGSQYCCVAQTFELPMCALPTFDANQITGGLELSSAVDQALLEDRCLGDRNRLSSSEAIDGTQRLSCKWGCCSNDSVQLVLENERQFDDALARVSDAVFEKGLDQSIPDQIKTLKQDYESAAGRDADQAAIVNDVRELLNENSICIFCCTF